MTKSNSTPKFTMWNLFTALCHASKIFPLMSEKDTSKDPAHPVLWEVKGQGPNGETKGSCFSWILLSVATEIKRQVNDKKNDVEEGSSKMFVGHKLRKDRKTNTQMIYSVDGLIRDMKPRSISGFCSSWRPMLIWSIFLARPLLLRRLWNRTESRKPCLPR